MKRFLFLSLCITVSSFFIACEKEEQLINRNNEPLPQEPEDNTVPDEFSLRWETLIDDSRNENDFLISTRYLGIQGWSCLATPPHLYVGATFPQSTFATSFDKEVVDKKYPIDLTFDFPVPYTTRMETVKGSEYLQKIKDAIRSEEYQSYTSPRRPHLVRFAALNSLSDIQACFPDNEGFGHTLQRIGQQELDMKNVKSLCMGEIIFKGFTVSMDVPSKGLFINEPFSPEDLVYIRTLTYGASAYFVIASDHSYQDVLTSFKKSFIDDYNNPKGVLHNSQIILLTVSGTDQEAEVKETFEDLSTFLKSPFMNGDTYGYPLYCKGFYTKNNMIFMREN